MSAAPIVVGFTAGACLQYALMRGRQQQWQRRQQHKADLQAMATRRQLTDALRHANIEVSIRRGGQ